MWDHSFDLVAVNIIHAQDIVVLALPIGIYLRRTCGGRKSAPDIWEKFQLGKR